MDNFQSLSFNCTFFTGNLHYIQYNFTFHLTLNILIFLQPFKSNVQRFEFILTISNSKHMTHLFRVDGPAKRSSLKTATMTTKQNKHFEFVLFINIK